MDNLESLKERARVIFQSRFGATPELLVCAPGRVNLIGEHTDYNDGFVFPAAIDRYVVVAAARSPDTSKVWSDGYPEPAVFDSCCESAMHDWSRFPSGCAWVLGADSYQPSNINATIVSNLPAGSGVSSSAALELAFLTLWNELDRLVIPPKSLAVYGQTCEHTYIGVHCGLMDQMACALGREDCAMLLDTRSKEVEYHRLPEEVEIVLCDTNKPRSLDVSAYNERQRECQEAASSMRVSSLRDATMVLLEGTFPLAKGVQYMRARHVLTENERCVQFAEALSSGDLSKTGLLMRASHESLRDDYEVSCEELDWMAESAWSATGCVGARMTGAGFGGACVALVEKAKLDSFIIDTGRRYKERSNRQEPRFLICRAVAGARIL